MTISRTKLSMILSALLAAASISISVGVHAQTEVYSSIGAAAVYYGRGTYSIENVDNGNAALGYGYPGYKGDSPTFEFVPTGIGAGENLSEFKVTIGNDEFTGTRNFHLTLFTSGSTEDTNPNHWTKLGYWAGQTDGQYNSGVSTPNPSLVSVTAALSGAQLTNGDHYYLMATADANQGVDGQNGYVLDWGDTSLYGIVNVWEPLDGTTYPSPFADSQAAFQVFVSGSGPDSTTPEPGSVGLAIASSLAGFSVLLRRTKCARANRR